MSSLFDYTTLQAWVDEALKEQTGLYGVVAYSGPSTWKPGKFMIFGFNPAADGTNEKLEKITVRPESWSLYADKCWVCGEERGANHPHRLTRHQRTIHQLCEAVNVDSPREVFATNAIFVESKDIASLPDWQELFDKCWHVHARFLEVIQPLWIICLGNSDSASSFSLIRKKFTVASSIKPCGKDFRDGKWFTGHLTAGQWSGKVSVLGIPHPSRFSITAVLREFVQKNVVTP